MKKKKKNENSQEGEEKKRQRRYKDIGTQNPILLPICVSS